MRHAKVSDELEALQMKPNHQELLKALKFELHFLEHGGYERSVRDPRRELSVFQDSPSCLNYALPERKHPCSECLLINFVPAEKRGESIPCHHIPLNESGDTLEKLQGYGRDLEVESATREWLRKTIAELETESTKQPA
jgi:hypothetical protein